MGLFGTIKKIGKGVLKGVGTVAKHAAPVIGLVPGVGTLAAGAIGGVGSVASDIGSGRGISLGRALKHGALGAAGGLAGKALRGAGAAAGAGKAASGGGLLGRVGQVGGALLGKAPGQGLSAADIAQLGIGGLSAIGAGKAAGRSADLQAEALRQAREEYASRSPYRAATSDLLLGRFPSERPDLSSAFAGSSNPFARSLRPAPVAAEGPADLPPKLPQPEPRPGPLADPRIPTGLGPVVRPVRNLQDRLGALPPQLQRLMGIRPFTRGMEKLRRLS